MFFVFRAFKSVSYPGLKAQRSGGSPDGEWWLAVLFGLLKEYPMVISFKSETSFSTGITVEDPLNTEWQQSQKHNTVEVYN